MLLCHVSDTHGFFPDLPPEAEVIVHSGDGMPNSSRGNLKVEPRFQSEWVRKNVETYKKWLGGRPLIYLEGNHCFIDPISILREAGIDAVNITNSHYQFKGIRLYGFPYVPYMAGEWNYECDSIEMSRHMRRLKDAILEGVDVLVAHAPPHGILDSNFVIRKEGCMVDYGERCGNTQLSNYLSYDLPDVPINQRPKYLLCGHIHQHFGLQEEFGMLISNAATVVHTIEIKL